ncbi:MAG: hypothetical protein ACXVPQ_04860 [Bacteroidia bacterium]
MKEFKLQLNLNEVNLILKSLGQQPYSQVHETIGKIQAHAQEQLTNEVISEARHTEKV